MSMMKCLLTMLSVAVLIGPACSSAAAQIEAGKVLAAKAAANQFVALAKGSDKSGAAPRESEPGVKRLLDAVFDARDVEAAKSIPFQALSPLGERMQAGTLVGLVYMLAGTGATNLGEVGTDPAAGEKINLNVIKFAPEMGRYLDFQIKIQGAVVDAVLVRLSSAKPEERARPNLQSGISNIQQGSARSVAGVIETLAVNGLTEEWRRERLPALTHIAPKLAKFLESAQKTELQQLARACADVMDDPQVKKSLQEFAAMMGN